LPLLVKVRFEAAMAAPVCNFMHDRGFFLLQDFRGTDTKYKLRYCW
jgi:hypothetical protein